MSTKQVQEWPDFYGTLYQIFDKVKETAVTTVSNLLFQDFDTVTKEVMEVVEKEKSEWEKDKTVDMTTVTKKVLDEVHHRLSIRLQNMPKP